MNERGSKVNKFSEQDQEKSSTSKGDSVVDQVKPRSPIHVTDTSIQLTASVTQTNSRINLTSGSNESEISVLPTFKMDDSSISAQSSASMNKEVQLPDSIVESSSSVNLASRINKADITSEPTALMTETDISIQLTTSLNEADISVPSTTLMNEADISVPPTTPTNEVDISVQPTKPMYEADISVQPTTPLNEADISVQPTYPNNVADLTARIDEVNISAQSTVPMAVANISGQSTAPTHYTGICVESFPEADNPVHPTDQINEADLLSTEEYQKAFRIVKWVDRMLDIFKILQGNDENVNFIVLNEHLIVPLNEGGTVLEKMLEDISLLMISTNIAEKDDYFSKQVTRMLIMLQETTSDALNSFNATKTTRPTIKVLAILIHHLAANTGTKVTLHDVQTCINEERVMKLFTKVQEAREPRYLKMSIVKRNLAYGLRRAQYLKRKSGWHKSKAEWIVAECAATVDLRIANENLKSLIKESQEFLVNYAKSVRSVFNKAKVFVTLKTDNEEVLNYFMTSEIDVMFEKET